MSLWFHDFKAFIKENYITLKVFFLIFILFYLLTGAIILVSKDYPRTTSYANSFNACTNAKTIKAVNPDIDPAEIPDDQEALKASISTFFNKLYSTRNSSFITGNVENLYNYFIMNTNDGSYSLHHEFKRIAYLRDWANERNITFTSITSYPNIRYIRGGPNTFNIRVDEEYKFEYVYNDEPDVKNEFGVSLFHIIKLNKNNTSYKIANDYYLDCFEDGLKRYSFTLKEKEIPITKESTYNINLKRNDVKTPKNKKLNREACKGYANKYCGVTWASKNPTKYNKKYFNFTGSGGNCTNYVSQCLGDKEGGALPNDSSWYFVTQKQEGSVAWLNADGFKNYILYSGKGKVVKKADFPNSLKPLKDGSFVFKNLYVGDLVSYDKKNDIDHNAIITGFDSKGYPLINSHTVDRYQVPFDLGWGDKDINFYFIHVVA
ncbi:amidase domain-containing protein [Clostridium sp. SHJSY1]|uniref:amidase domain-containing protein n=1 Tax=Clostridium sp. SHJSY1 TaxID=2942483 RepID=UPI00287546A0|nr:amidase domain-containing protein [Clostridium sp. SHJSY1]MDS0525802.1 amidase domain-containing protein [Clostridium sp. SHJSY1]